MSEQQSGEHDNEHADVTVILLSREWERHAELDFVDFFSVVAVKNKKM